MNVFYIFQRFSDENLCNPASVRRVSPDIVNLCLRLPSWNSRVIVHSWPKCIVPYGRIPPSSQNFDGENYEMRAACSSSGCSAGDVRAPVASASECVAPLVAIRTHQSSTEGGRVGERESAHLFGCALRGDTGLAGTACCWNQAGSHCCCLSHHRRHQRRHFRIHHWYFLCVSQRVVWYRSFEGYTR